jgi:hypothetical protein
VTFELEDLLFFKRFISEDLTNKMQHRIFFFHDGREIKKMIASTGKKEIKEKNIKKIVRQKNSDVLYYEPSRQLI